MKISRVDEGTIVPKLLPNAGVEPTNLFRLEVRIVAENFVLAGWRTEPGRITRMQNRVRNRKFVITRDPPGPDATELVEVIVATAANQSQALEWNNGGLHESCDLLGVIADEGRLRSEILGDKRSFLA